MKHALFSLVASGFLAACTQTAAQDVQTVASAPANQTDCNCKEEMFPFAPPSARVESWANGPSAEEIAKPTRVVMLGTGTPVPDAYRAGPSVAVIHRGQAYIFDIGAGSVRRAIEARYKYDIPGLYPSSVRAVFLTHMHSDHVADLSELAHTFWWRRSENLLVFGPSGLTNMADAMDKELEADIRARLDGVQPVSNTTGYQLEATEISDGIIFQDTGITIEAFTVPHGDINPAFGYKIVADDMTIVISGDTAASEIIREKARGADLLIHEVISDKGLSENSPFWQAYHKSAHTLASDVGKIANDAQPKTLVLYHGLFYGTAEADVVAEVAEFFKGKIVLADDLELFEATR